MAVGGVVTTVRPSELSLLSKLALTLIVLLIVAGVLWHGVTPDTIGRMWRQLLERPSARMWFRFILQPTMAVIAAVHDGLRDVRAGRSPYVRAILRKPEKRAERLREGLNATARIILLGLAMDTLYQILVLGSFYPNEAVVVALLLAFLPYVILRGLVARLHPHRRARRQP
jgi:hypothetical protein